MMASMFSASSSIKKAVSLINDISITRFPILLSRILQKLHLKEERTFSEDEEEKLQAAFNLGAQDLELIVGTLEFIIQQAAYHTAKLATFEEQLTQLGLDEDKVNVIIDAWTKGARDLVHKLRERTVHPMQLEDVNWRLNLQMGQARQAKMKFPSALFQLSVRNEEAGIKEHVRVEFTHEELFAFYNQLETIQKQLDNLS